jgi:hypothetical protein
MMIREELAFTVGGVNPFAGMTACERRKLEASQTNKLPKKLE